ncbi:MAG TPA: BrnA antitoxin family protein [Rhodocyclaceae bacterium]|nr:BrnA antitoxin family protein [Rhodocyclaceae bacterium]
MKNSYDFSQGARGPVVSQDGKTRITLYLDNAILDAFRTQAAAQGKGYRTLINEALRQSVQPDAAPLTVEVGADGTDRRRLNATYRPRRTLPPN